MVYIYTNAMIFNLVDSLGHSINQNQLMNLIIQSIERSHLQQGT